MKTLLYSILAMLACTAAFAERALDSVGFELLIGGEAFICSTLIESPDGRSHHYGPVLVYPASMKGQCSVGVHGGTFFVGTLGTTEPPAQDAPWSIRYRDLRISARPGLLYFVRADGDGYSLASIPFNPAPDAAGATLKDQLLALLR